MKAVSLKSTKTVLASAFALALLSSPVQALQITASADWTLAGAAGTGSPDVDGPASTGFVDVLGSDASGSNDVFYHTYGNDTGTFGSRVSGNGMFDISGTFLYDNNFTTTGGDVDFTFTVIPGELSNSIGAPLLAGEEVVANYDLDIRVNGVSIWDSSAVVHSDDTGTHFFDTGTNSIGGTFSGSRYSWSSFTDTITLGTFAAGETFTLEYELTSMAASNASAACSGGFGDGEFGDFPDRELELEFEFGDGEGSFACTGALARIGDPFHFSGGNSFAVSGASASVPEPATLALFAGGLLGLAGFRRKRSA